MLNKQNIGVYKYIKMLRGIHTDRSISRDIVIQHLLNGGSDVQEKLLDSSYVIEKSENTWVILEESEFLWIRIMILEIIHYEPILIDLSNTNTNYPLIYIKDIIKTPIKTFLDYIPLLKYRVFFTSDVNLIKFIKDNIDKL